MITHQEITERAISVLDDLIAFRSVSSVSNLDIIEYIEQYLVGFGIESMRVYNDEKNKANLYATLGPRDRGGIILSGHTDVVPVEGQDWHTDPFAMTRKNGRLYGRGTADMKSFIACVLAMVPEFAKADLQTPLHFAFSHDEEVGCVGVRSLLEILKDIENKPVMCIVGEPSEMGVIIAHKGKQYLRARVRGKECHSSLSPTGVNAVHYAARLVSFIEDIDEEIAASGPFDEDFDVPRSTLMTGVIHGGTNLNIVPNECWFDFEIREIPTVDAFAIYDRIKAYAAEILEPKMKAADPSTGIAFEEVSLRPSLDTQPNEDVVTMVKKLAGKNSHTKVAFGTEAALFQKMAGIPTVVCGPGNIEQAHKPQEFIEIDQIAQCVTVLGRLLEPGRT